MNINNNDSTMKLLKLGLDASSLRGQTISNNMSNINTANYKRSYVNFEENLSTEVNKISLKKTKEAHLLGSENTSSSLISVEQDNNSSMRTDGNNVDLDIEKVNQATNSLMYNALITQANSKLSMTKSVINGGN